MSSSFGAMCTDFYVNQKIDVTMDLPTTRETILDLFDRVKKVVPVMDRLRRFDGEIALESTEAEGRYSWLALRQTSVRSGWVNPETLEQAYALHQLVLETAPWFLSINAIDVEAIELIFGFDLHARANRNQIVYDALLADSPLANLIEPNDETLLDVQPFLGLAVDNDPTLQASLEIKTRTSPKSITNHAFDDEPLSVYLTVRKQGPFKAIDTFPAIFGTLAGHAERLAEQRVIPGVVVPLHEQIIRS
ncbi:MAG: hypothetical protein MK095_08250 [Phycisphaerales bacterium]|jgi:hypothetical protein|nr:hypothetical protein [Phycisphaerales bacterium]